VHFRGRFALSFFPFLPRIFVLFPLKPFPSPRACLLTLSVFLFFTRWRTRRSAPNVVSPPVVFEISFQSYHSFFLFFFPRFPYPTVPRFTLLGFCVFCLFPQSASQHYPLVEHDSPFLRALSPHLFRPCRRGLPSPTLFWIFARSCRLFLRGPATVLRNISPPPPVVLFYSFLVLDPPSNVPAAC